MYRKNYLVYSGKYADYVEKNKDLIFYPFKQNIIVLREYEKGINLVYPPMDELICEFIKNEINKEISLEQAHNLFFEYFDGSLYSVISALIHEKPIKNELKPILVLDEKETRVVIYPLLPSYKLLQRQKLPSYFSFYEYYSLFSNISVFYDEKGNVDFKVL